MWNIHMNQAIAYPSNRLHRAGNYKTMFDTTQLPFNAMHDGRKTCYNVSKGTYIYKPHSAIGRVGVSSASYRAQRKRI